MGAVNVTIRVDEDVKRDFDTFCDNVGMNITTAINMFIRATLRNRELPFSVSDSPVGFVNADDDAIRRQASENLYGILKSIQQDSIKNHTDNMTMDEINAEIAASRRERRATKV